MPDAKSETDAANTVDVWRFWIDRRHQRVQTQAACNGILRRYLDLPVNTAPVIERRSGGKPFVANPPGRLEFNLSHSHELALLAVSTVAPVGIDVERLRSISDPLRIAERVWPEADVAWLKAQAVARQRDAFFEGWTRFEAQHKALGRGIFGSAVDPTGLRGVRFVPTSGYVAYLAIDQAEVPQLRYFDYRDP